MRKTLTIIAVSTTIVTLLILLCPSLSIATPPDSWNPPGPTYGDPTTAQDPDDTCAPLCHGGAHGVEDYGPHDSYVSTGDECEMCHSPHQAGVGGSSYKLTRATSKDDTCDYCHIGAGAKTVLTVYPDGKTGQNGHEIEPFTGGIPDSDNGAGGVLTLPDDRLTCTNCHSVHGANLVNAPQKRVLLKADPAGNGGVANSMNAYCSDCHNRNWDTASGGDSHVMKPAGSKASASSELCQSCHAAKFHAADFPHSSGGAALLDQTADRDSMDEVCLKCHGAVGTNY